MEIQAEPGSIALVNRLQQAINQHNVDALTSCFAADYESESPAHPDRAFRGHEQMRKNWSQIFGAVPNLKATLLRAVSEGNISWAEWEWHGTRVDGTPFLMRGVTLQEMRQERIAWSRLYMEPVLEGQGSDVAIRDSIGKPG